MRREINLLAEIDWWSIFAYLVLVIFGLMNIYSAVYQPEHPSLFDFDMRYGKQVVWILLAFFFAVMIFLIDARFYQFIAYPLYILVMVSLIGVILFGTEVNGAKSWFEIGPMRIQPAEFGKVATVLALAKFLSGFNTTVSSPGSLFRIAVIVFLPSILILIQNDTGSAIVYFALVLTLYREGLSGLFLWIGLGAATLFVLSFMVNQLILSIAITAVAILYYALDRKTLIEPAIALLATVFSFILFHILNDTLELGMPDFMQVFLAAGLVSLIMLAISVWKKIRMGITLSLIVISSMLFLSSVDFVFNDILEKHQQTRILVLLGLKEDPQGAGYNVNQSKIAIGSGGFAGKGFLQGTQTKYDFVPEQSTDFIFCTVGEEWGFLGATAVVLAFVFLLLRLIILAERQRSNFNRIVGWGVIAILFFHFAINILMTIGLAPVIGIPLPFFSYGGSSLWGFTLLLFIFLKLDSSRKEFLQ
jgi:rod shape determining protein RodA